MWSRRALPLAVALLAAGLFGPSATAEGSRPVKVMTRNLYLGADLGPAMRATTTSELVAAGAHVFSVVQRTDFPQRAKALAREVADADPVLLGLQEAAIWYSGPFNDPSPATTVVYDFLAILRDELAAAGAPYDVVRVQPEADVEAPAGAPHHADVRLVQHDAILVKSGSGDEVVLDNARSGNFTARLVVTNGLGQPTEVDRGWVSVDAVVNRRPFRFVNTHLEAFHPLVRLQQALELIAPGGPVGSARGPVVLVGDLNSGPELPSVANRLAFAVLAGYGLADTWAVANPGQPGYTAAFDELLDDSSAEGALEHRIDHIMASGASSRHGSTGPIPTSGPSADCGRRTTPGWPRP